MFNKIVKLLKSKNYMLQLSGHVIYTPHCTIEVFRNGIDINEQRVEFDQVLSIVKEAEESHGSMITVKCTYEDGNTITTGFNGSESQARQFFVGEYFNLGIEYDDVQKCIDMKVI